MSWIVRMRSIDTRILYVLIALSIAFPLLRPMGLPIDIGKETRDVYAAVDSLSPGSVLVLCPDYSSSNATEMNPMITAVFRHAMQRDVKVLMFATVLEGPSLAQPLVEPIAMELDKTYGVDWVNLGYKPGGNVTLTQMTDDLWTGAANVDAFNTPLSQIPMMDNLKALRQTQLIIDISGVAPGPSRYLTYVGIPGNVPVTGGMTSVSVPEEMPYVRSGQYKGFLMGLKGAAEYELLLEKPGQAVAGMDAQSMAHLLVIVFIILANIGHFADKSSKKGAQRPAAS